VIQIKSSKMADTRSCDFSKVTKLDLLRQSHMHIDDVQKGFLFLVEIMKNRLHYMIELRLKI
jgi:hypothetical protein